MKKLFIALFIVAVAALGAAGYFYKEKIHGLAVPEKKEKDPFPSEKVVRRDIEKSVDVSGFVEPFLATEVKSEVSGKINKIAVENGDRVKAGQLLVELDPTLVKADLEEAERNLENNRITLEKTQRDYDRFQKLYEAGFATEKDLLDAKTANANAEIMVKIQNARIEKGQENLRKTTISAPHDGMVTNCDVNPGQVVVGAGSVNSGTTLMKVNDLSQLIVQANLNEFDVAKIDQNPPVMLSFDSMPGVKITGKLFYISPSGISTSTTTTALSTALRVFPIKVSFPSEGLVVRPGISANIKMVIARANRVLSVPVSAVFIESGDRVVYLKTDDGRFERKIIETGINNDSFIEIVKGLDEGDRVSLVRPPEFL